SLESEADLHSLRLAHFLLRTASHFCSANQLTLGRKVRFGAATARVDTMTPRRIHDPVRLRFQADSAVQINVTGPRHRAAGANSRGQRSSPGPIQAAGGYFSVN